MRFVFCYPAFYAAVALTCVGCVPAGKFKAMERQAHLSDSLYTQSMRTLNGCQDDNSQLTKQKSTLQQRDKDLSQQLTATNEVNGQLRKQLQDLSAVSTAQAESIKRSLDNMGANDSYMIALHSALSSRDSMNVAVVLNLKQALGGYGEQDVDIKLEKGAVHVDLSDSLLFNGDSTGYTVSDKAKTVLGRLARALNDQPDVEFMVEGRCDTLAQPTDCVLDNWDIGVKRATAIVRILQNDRVSPARMTAAGKSEWIPMTPGDTTARPAYHPTRILILPQMDRLLQLLGRRGSS
jgi:chemotaxis protein MotB